MPMAREQLRQATHQRVLQAAERLFQDRGFAATTVRDIAAAADVSVGTVMSVGDKRSLLVQVFDSKISAEHEQRPDVSGGHGDDSTCADRLELLVRPFVVLFTDRPEVARIYASILVSGAHSSALFSELAEHLTEEFEAAVAGRECVPQAEARPLAQALYAAYVGTLFTWSGLGLSDPEGLSQRLRSTFRSICRCEGGSGDPVA